jgi:hypothetical protein
MSRILLAARHSSLATLFLSLLLYLLTSLLPISTSAQSPATGTPPFGSFGGGPDVINLGNLNVHLDIPVLRRTGRGKDFIYDLTYDSSVWYLASANGSQSWQPILLPGWQGLSPAQPGGIVYMVTISYSSPHSPCSVTQYQYSNFSYWDNSGTQHA